MKKAIAAYVGIIVAIVLLGLGGWGLSVAFSPVKGQGDAYKAKNSAANRIAAQERFHERYQDVLATDAKLSLYAELAKGGDKTSQQNYVGTRSYCLSAVAEYNADARKYTAAAFRDADLPAQIDPIDPSTDCKEN